MSDEPELRTLYEFDWDTLHYVKTRDSGTNIGWWDGRHWVGAFGDGMWSPQYVHAFRRLAVAPAGSGEQE
jgi:hypothetical protein